MRLSSFFLLLELVLLVFASGIHGQAPAPDSSEFISIDCGIDAGTSHVDEATGLTYVSDDAYTDLGTNGAISPPYIATAAKKEATLRSFPNSTRSCYALSPVAQFHKYLVRATFTYGNYDRLHRASPYAPLQFDLHIDVNFWMTVNVTDESSTSTAEALIVAVAGNFLSVCLVNTGHGVPFISSLELRPLASAVYSYINTTMYFLLYWRLDAGTNYTTRYPTDPFDRIWSGVTSPTLSNIATDSTVEPYTNDAFLAPSAVLQTAVTPAGNFSTIVFRWNFADTGFRNNEFYINVYFTELVALRANQSRAFNISLNGKVVLADYSPPYLWEGLAYSNASLTPNSTYSWELTPNATSTLPPILNALEVYSTMYLTNVTTTASDVDAITAIKAEYKVSKYWTGDPCAPREYAWDGLNCSYIGTPSIIAVNLSSSGLIGEISLSFGKLAAIKYLDLSYNNLTGKIPDAFGDLSYLQVLNLTGNKNVIHQIPNSLTERMKHGLQIIFDNSTNPSSCEDCHPLNITLIVTLSVVAGVVLLILLAFIFWWRRRNPEGPQHGTPRRSQTKDHPQQFEHPPPTIDDCQPMENIFDRMPMDKHGINFDSMQFTYSQLANMTNSFSRIIGKGGFGYVYHGYLREKEVAVKMHFQSSPQGAKQFFAETHNLTRAYHKNLVKLVGYCIEDKYLGLVYEFMPQGSLQQYLKGEADRLLSWKERIQIAIGAAEGLEYLHKGCSPAIIHRDIKSANILLGKGLEAKIADFGMSKSFSSDDQTHVSTAHVVGTPGYLDPEYHHSYQLTVKSDVFSFGVVLLELLTGQSPLVPGSGKPHIAQQVASALVRGTIDEVVDQRLEGDFEVNSAWKLAELAKQCTATAGSKRPTMSEVVSELKDCLELAVARRPGEIQHIENFSSFQISGFEIEVSGAGLTGPIPR